jgi:hypothetical protein
MKNESVDFSRKGRGEGSNKFDRKFYKSEQPNTTNSFDRETPICPYGVSPTKLARVTKVHFLVQDLLKYCRTKLAIQEVNLFC